MAKTRFSVVSPRTGAVHTRQSARAYTHACLVHESAESMALQEERYAEKSEREAARYAADVASIQRGEAREWTADDYKRWVEQCSTSAVYHRARAAELRAKGEGREWASFHHSAALAAKEVAKWAPAGARWYAATVLPVEAR